MTEARRSPVARWLSVVLRGLHLAAVIGLGAALMGAPLDGQLQSLGVLISGLAMLALDLWMKPHLLLEWSGAALLIKLAMVGWMALDGELRPALFWILVLWSAVFAHAPGRIRHARWWAARA